MPARRSASNLHGGEIRQLPAPAHQPFDSSMNERLRCSKSGSRDCRRRSTQSQRLPTNDNRSEPTRWRQGFVGCDQRSESNGWCARAGDVRVTKASTKLAGSPRRHTEINVQPTCHTQQNENSVREKFSRTLFCFVGMKANV